MYKKVLLKLSGEALAGEDKKGINGEVLNKVCLKIKELVDMNIKVCIVTGGGNFWRGRASENMNRVNADYIGMLGTTMNSIAISDTLNGMGVKAHTMSALEMNQICETFNYEKAKKYLDNNEVVVFACGTGHPYFSTDTAAALRSVQMECDAILCGKTIDAVYSDDPKKNPNAERYSNITFDEVIKKNLQVMDQASIAICRDNNMKILVFGMDDLDNINRVLNGENVGTKIF